MTAVFSVIIPTLQRSARLPELVERCSAHPLVLEVLVINNATTPLPFTSPKLRVLQQSENIFVNPAWNLGVREARGEFVAIVNDDVLFEDAALVHAAKILRRGLFGIVGPDSSTFHHESSGERVSHRFAGRYATVHGYGTFMCLRRGDYVPIPEEMRIWGGDDWLVEQQRRPPAALIRTRFDTEMNTTSGSPEFMALRAAEKEIAGRMLEPLRGRRWWHGLQDWWAVLRAWKHRLRHRAGAGAAGDTPPA